MIEVGVGPRVFGPFLNWLVFAPLWSVALVLLAGGGLCIAAGWQFRRLISKQGTSSLGSDQEGYVLSAVSGLLALLIGFTFAVAIDRFDMRRDRVLDEANAIQTVYVQAQLLPEPHRTRISQIVVSYVDTRTSLGAAAPGPERQALYRRSEELVTDLGAAATSAFASIKSLDFSSTFADSVSRVMETRASWLNGRQSHVPADVYALLFVYQLMAAGLLGFVLTGSVGRQVAVALLILSAAALLLVIEIDRPVTGRINEPQDAMRNLQIFLRQRPPKAFDRYAEPSTPDAAATSSGTAK